MPPKNAVGKDKGKRKRVEVVEAPSFPPPSPSSFQFHMPAAQLFPAYPSTAFQLDLNNFEGPNAFKNMMLMSAPSLSLQLNTAEDGGGGGSNSLTSMIKENHEQIIWTINANNEKLKRTLTDMQHRQYTSLFLAAEEKASKRLKEKDHEILKTVNHYRELEENEARMKTELQQWKNTTNRLEIKMLALQSALQEAIRGGRTEGGGFSEAADQESSHVDPNRVESVRMVCKGCGKRVTTMMLWQCRHVCLCKNCDEITRNCPVCLSVKAGSFEVYLD